MLKKIYLAVMAIAMILMLFFTFYAYSWLQSIGSPEIAANNFSFYSGLGWNFLWLSYIGLVVFSAIIIWKAGRSWSLWVAFAYFAVFVTLHTFWLASSFQSFLTTHKLADQTFTFDPVFGSVIVVVIAIATFFTQFILFRMRDKIVGDETPELEDVAVD